MDRAQRLSYYEGLIERSFAKASKSLAARTRGEIVSDFNIRGELYDLAHRLAPLARMEEVEAMRDIINPRDGESCLDVCAGTGFLTKQITDWTNVPVYALEPSREQLTALERNVPSALRLQGYPDDPNVFEIFAERKFDIVTSLAGLHHVQDQQRLFNNIAGILSPAGRFVLGDVCRGSLVAQHFDGQVAEKSLTGHTARWLDGDRISSMAEHAGLKVKMCESRATRMLFQSDSEMGLFYKGLHAFPMETAEVISRIYTALGANKDSGRVATRWPLIFARLELK